MSPYFWDMASCEQVIGARRFETVVFFIGLSVVEDETAKVSRNVGLQSANVAAPYPSSMENTM